MIQARNAEIAALKSEIEQLESHKPAPESTTGQQLATLKEKLAGLEKADPLSDVPTAYAVGELQPMDVPVQPGGNPGAKPGKVVKRGVPKAIDDQPLPIAEGSSGRLELARWMTTSAQHLTARVLSIASGNTILVSRWSQRLRTLACVGPRPHIPSYWIGSRRNSSTLVGQ